MAGAPRLGTPAGFGLSNESRFGVRLGTGGICLMWKWVEKEGIGTSTKILLAVSTCARPRGFPREEVEVSV